MSEELKRDGAGQATGWENMDSAPEANTESRPKGDHHEEQDVPMTFDIDETGFSAVSELSKITGVDEAILYRAFNSACVGEKDPVGSKIDANTIWQYYLNGQQENGAKNEPSSSDRAIDNKQASPRGGAVEYDEGQERVYTHGLNQIENGQITVGVDPEGFRLNHSHTVEYLKKVIANSQDPANKKRAEELLARQLEIAKEMGL